MYKQSLEANTEKSRIENNLRSNAPYDIGKDLKSGETHSIPVLLRGDNVGKKALHLIVVYKQKVGRYSYNASLLTTLKRAMKITAKLTECCM